jgi:phenylacetate-CoA ligase
MNNLNLEHFHNIVQHARTTNPFYRSWLPTSGPIPILTRSVLQQNNDLILNSYPVLTRTSGSTATPICVAMNPERQQMDLADTMRFIELMGGPLPRTEIINPRDMVPPPSFVPILTPIHEQIVRLLDAYQKRQAVALITYPSNAVELAHHIREHSLDFSFMRRIGLISESFDSTQRALIQAQFPQAFIWSSYSAMELGIISFQCPYETNYHHYMSHKLGLEILNDNHQPCEMGEIGRVIITDYYNQWMPLIRYEIGDLAAWGECPCGRIPLPALGTILGKSHGLLRHRNGQRIPFVNLSVRLAKLPSLRQYQVIQETIDHVRVRFSAEENLDQEIRSAVESELGPNLRIDLEPTSHFPRNTNGKFNCSICKV